MRAVKFILVAITAGVLCASAAANDQAGKLRGQIEGTITDQSTGEPLIGASIYLVDRFGGAITDEEGQFVIGDLQPDTYSLRVSHLGFEPYRIDSIVVLGGQTATVTADLVETVYDIRGITVTPGTFAIMGTEAVATQSLTRRELETMPQFGEDLYRAVNRLPGVFAEDFTARFFVRGGEYEEVLVILDGVQLYEPFHLKDFKGGFFSAVDAAAIESIDLMTGGFTAEYGDRASGVFNIKSHHPPSGERKVSAALSFMNARLMTEGTFADNRGSWMVSGRRGYLDILLKIAGEGEKWRPTYYDLLGKVQYQLSGSQVLSAHVFHAGDRFKVIDDDDNDADTVITSYDNSYAWLNLKSQLNSKLYGQTVLSVGQVRNDRFGFAFWRYQQLEDAKINDLETFTVAGGKTDWQYELSDNHLLKTGFEARALSAEYDYLATDQIYFYTQDGTVELERIDTVRSMLEPSGNQIGAYLSHRARLSPLVTVELGGRFDRHSYTGDEHLSPRVNAAYQAGENTTIRGGWGYFYQAQRIDELSPGDRLTEFFPAERAEHKTIGLEHRYGKGICLRLEAYHKKYTDLKPELRNTFDDFQAFPEFEDDRIVVHRDNSVARGFEVYFKREKGSRFTWCTSYAYSEIEDQVNHILYKDPYGGPDKVRVDYDQTFPNPYDQRHTVYLDVSYRPTLKWQCNLAWSYHTGWPYTGVYLASAQIGGETVYWVNQGEFLGMRYPAYSRIDFRLNRYFDFWGGRLTAFFEVINVLNRDNVRGYGYELTGSGGSLYIERNTETALPRLPVLGVTYSLNM